MRKACQPVEMETCSAHTRDHGEKNKKVHLDLISLAQHTYMYAYMVDGQWIKHFLWNHEGQRLDAHSSCDC